MSAFVGNELALELLDPGSVSFQRLFRHKDAEWVEPEPKYRTQRCDPPRAHATDYALLYMADSVAAAAVECRILNADRNDRYTYDEALTKAYWVARYSFTNPAVFIPIDADNRATLGLNGFKIGYAHYQQAAHELWTRYRNVAHGLSWSSFHRNQPGRVYALWHEHKTAIGLKRPVPPFQKLFEDLQWTRFLKENPDIGAIAVAP